MKWALPRLPLQLNFRFSSKDPVCFEIRAGMRVYALGFRDTTADNTDFPTWIYSMLITQYTDISFLVRNIYY